MKKKKSGGGANWMDTYGDMVTLLLCFFVLLYSMSTISEDKWKAIVQSFNPQAIQDITVTPGGSGASADDDLGGIMEQQAEIDTMIEELYEALTAYANQEGMTSTIQVTMEGGRVYVKFTDTVFFDGDSSTLRPEARVILSRVCEMLDVAARAIDEIRIQGHTAQGSPYGPNNPRTDRFLASNRATEVLLFVQLNSTIHPARLVGEGMGQWRPISGNATAEDRAYNRRVEMIITGRDLDAEAFGDAIQSYISMDTADAEP